MSAPMIHRRLRASYRSFEHLPTCAFTVISIPMPLPKGSKEWYVLLICYAVADDPNRGCNSHKILEYLSTGRVIVSNHVPDYAGRPDLIRMVPTTDNAPLALLFGETIRDVRMLNEPTFQAIRISHALCNTYAKQLDRIEQLIQRNGSSGGDVIWSANR